MAISVVALVLVMAMATAMLPTGVLWLLTHGEEIGERARAIGRRCRLLRPAPVVTHDPPIERIAADLRRLSRQRRQQHGGGPAARPADGLRRDAGGRLPRPGRAALAGRAGRGYGPGLRAGTDRVGAGGRRAAVPVRDPLTIH